MSYYEPLSRWRRFRRWLFHNVLSDEIRPDQLRAGDQLLFDFPGSGPYWTTPISEISQSDSGTWYVSFDESPATAQIPETAPIKVKVRNLLRGDDRE